MKTIEKLLPHLTIVLAGMLLVLAVLDRYNPSMDYMANTGTAALLVALCISAILTAIALIAHQRRR